MIKCSKCQKKKRNSEFHVLNKSKGTYGRYCKKCKKEYDKRYRKSDKIQSLYKSKRYRDRKREYGVWKTRTSPEMRILISAKSRAKTKGLPFNITIKDIIIPEFCPLLGISIFPKPYNKGISGFTPNSPSLDRIIPELGYVKNNIMVISMKANAMKYNATIEELKIFAKNILNMFK